VAEEDRSVEQVPSIDSDICLVFEQLRTDFPEFASYFLAVKLLSDGDKFSDIQARVKDIINTENPQAKEAGLEAMLVEMKKEIH
jgi:hypothetical protein